MTQSKKQRGRLFVISGPSGAGKGTICQRLIEDVKDQPIEVSVSMTTRKPRVGEVDGKSYFFTTHEDFKKEIEKGGLLEYAEVYGNYYGTPKAKVLEKLEKGIDVILEIDIQGALKVKEAFPKGVFIFVLPPSMAILRKRLTGRGTDSIETINMRLGETLKELTYIDKYDYCVVNGDLEEAVTRAKSILKAEHSKVTEDIYDIIDQYREEK